MDQKHFSYANVMATIAVVLAVAAAFAVLRTDDGHEPSKDLVALSDSLSAKDFAPEAVEPGERWNNLGDENGPALNNFKAFFAPPHNRPAFVRDRGGFVHLRGLIAPGDMELASGSEYTLFTLPPGYRPARREVQGVLRGDGQVDRLDIRSNGTVIWGTEPNSGDLGPSTFLSLDGISFMAAPLDPGQ